MGKLIWSPEAGDNLAEIKAFIAENSPYFAPKFIEELIDYPERLLIFPDTGKLIPNSPVLDAKEIFYKDYRIAYREKGCNIEVLAVHHGNKLPHTRL
jgi:toxin ParE1/3/4